MKKIIMFSIVLVLLASNAFAFNLFETRTEAKERRRAEWYYKQQNNPMALHESPDIRYDY